MGLEELEKMNYLIPSTDLLNCLYQDDGDEVNKYMHDLMQFYWPYLEKLEPPNFSQTLKIIQSCNFDESSDNYELFDFACNCYKAVAIFPTDDRKKALVQLFSLKEAGLIWITDYKHLVDEVKKINESGKVFLKFSTVLMTYYSMYLPTKIRNQLAFNFKMIKEYDGSNKNEFEILLFKYFQNQKKRKRSGSQGLSKQFEKDLAEIIEYIEKTKYNSYFSSKTILIKEASGRIEDLYIAPLFFQAFGIKGKPIKKSDKVVLFFDLFRFIMKDKNWMNEVEFENRDMKIDNNGNPIGVYENSYRRYQQVTMKKFLQKK